MAKAITTNFKDFVLRIGDAATPSEAFHPICGAESIELQIEKDMNSTQVPDCDDADAPVWNETDVVSMGWTISGEGVMAKQSFDKIEGATFSTEPRNIKLRIVGGGTGSGTPDREYSGAGHVVISSLGAERGQRVRVSFEITGDGALAATNVAALA